jgi:tetratricopeptide (TPR) repeat protein
MLTACGVPPRAAKDLPKRENVQAPIESPDLPGLNNALSQQHARQLLDAQDYIGTINFIQDGRNKGAGEKILSEEYLQAANSSLDQADALMKKGDYPGAAILLKTVQDGFPQSLELQQQVTTSPTQLTDKIDLCTEKLMEAGLIAYRSGELARAIKFWEQILEYNPQHQDARNSIQTTQLQLAKLRTLNSKGQAPLSGPMQGQELGSK